MGALLKSNKIQILLRGRFLRLATMFVFLSISPFGPAQSDPWLLVATGETGSINARTKREDLIRQFGASNVVDRDVDVGEGEMQSATFVFPQDPERSIEILWKDMNVRANPGSAEIRGRRSRWHGVRGISLGTSLMELEHANGRPFRFSLVNDGTDMADEPISWEGGSLEKDFQGAGRVILWLEGSPAKPSKQNGPKDFSGESNTLPIRKMNLHVTSMTWRFPSPKRP